MNQFQSDRKTKKKANTFASRTFPNIKQQFEIDVDATRVTLISKNILLFAFQFLEKMFFNTMFETVKTI